MVNAKARVRKTPEYIVTVSVTPNIQANINKDLDIKSNITKSPNFKIILRKCN
jgi:hypothetical protein